MSDHRDVKPERLPGDRYADQFADVKPPLTAHQAAVESDRCYFCYDAPCVQACPTGIDIPSFIGKIRSGNLQGSAQDILDENIFGAMCARVCPVETLCEQSCVRNTGEEKPVAIGILQRFATDHVLEQGTQLFSRQASTGKRVAVVGGGPAGLSCAHRLAMLGNDVVVFEARPKLGGLNEHGIAAYKVGDNIAQREIDYLLEIGGIEVKTEQRLGEHITLAQLRKDYDAVFLGFGLGNVNQLGFDDENVPGVVDAVHYIEKLRQSDDLSSLLVGRRVVVIGGGMTAIDIAVQTKLLGAEEVTIAYRRGPERMGASPWERDLAQTHGVKIQYWAKPERLVLSGGEATGVEVETTALQDGTLVGTGDKRVLPADMIFKAIGQKIVADPLDGEHADILDLHANRIEVDGDRRTSLTGVWAGGDCVAISQDLTVGAVEDGKLAAHDIHRALGGTDHRPPPAHTQGSDAATKPIPPPAHTLR